MAIRQSGRLTRCFIGREGNGLDWHIRRRDCTSLSIKSAIASPRGISWPISKTPVIGLPESTRAYACFVIVDASVGVCFRSRPIPRFQDLVCRVNLHLARERYRGLAGAGASRGQCGCRSLRPPRSEACLALRLAFQEAFAKAGRIGSRFVELTNSIML